MMKRVIIAAIATAAMSVAAEAGRCPGDMARIDAALKSAMLSPADKTKVIQLRAKGAKLHASGRHGESIRTLARAKKILGIY